MKLSSAANLLVVGVVGVVVYEVWKYFQNPNSAPNQLAAAVAKGLCATSTGIANAYVGATTCAPITANGNVIFPSGAQVSVSALPVSTCCTGQGATVQYQGNVYQLSPSNSEGNYVATQIS